MISRFIKNIILFLSYATLCYALFVIAWTYFVPFNFLKKNAIYLLGAKGFTFSRMVEAKSIENVDILFLGSSHAYRSFDPRIYSENDIKSFNLGSPSQSPIQTKLLVQNFIDRLNPKLVIYEVYPATFQSDGLESALDIIANSEDLSNGFEMVIAVNHIKVYNALIIDSFREILDLNEGFVEETKNNYDVYVKGGFVETTLTQNVSPITEAIKQKWKSKSWEVKKQQWRAFKETLEILRQHQVEVMLVQTPVTSEAYELYINNDEMDSLFRQEAKYYNFNNSIELNDSLDFADYHHLNQRGVNKLNVELLNMIKQGNYFTRN